ncbi:hemerythrin domain-containing protein [Pendulispora albinea]|uniref:Hemerythrin domain-containing protein n=1 Tax=Pendulispora albinea TaxID=2741071 RepID=A0ABZ2LQ76_9BACT
MKATELLKKQHNEVKNLFSQLERGNGNAKTLLNELANNLAAHMVIEQEIFYPAVLEADKDLVLESYEEHAVARFALKRLMRAQKNDDTFKAKLITLKEIIEHHVEEEEEELFPKAEKALKERSTELGVEMKSLFDETKRLGYERVVGKGGVAVTSGHAPASARA